VELNILLFKTKVSSLIMISAFKSLFLPISI
jgi:hypothetical protein